MHWPRAQLKSKEVRTKLLDVGATLACLLMWAITLIIKPHPTEPQDLTSQKELPDAAQSLRSKESKADTESAHTPSNSQ